jgi:hypothetical protein
MVKRVSATTAMRGQICVSETAVIDDSIIPKSQGTDAMIGPSRNAVVYRHVSVAGE